MKVRYSIGARADLDEIFSLCSFIAADKPDAAAALVEHIERVAALIGDNPEMERTTKRPGIRKFPVVNYLIVYEITDRAVIIR